MNYPELRESVIALARRDRPSRILIEEKASGISLLQDLRSAGIESVQAYSPPAGADKIMRLHGQTAVFANGHVLLPRQAPWLAEYIAELTGFPGTRHDDQVDSTTQALQYVRSDCDQAEIWANFGRQVRESGILESGPFYPPPFYP
jgi:predicted phage terminase large subunit-like protein